MQALWSKDHVNRTILSVSTLNCFVPNQENESHIECAQEHLFSEYVNKQRMPSSHAISLSCTPRLVKSGLDLVESCIGTTRWVTLVVGKRLGSHLIQTLAEKDTGTQVESFHGPIGLIQGYASATFMDFCGVEGL